MDLAAVVKELTDAAVESGSKPVPVNNLPVDLVAKDYASAWAYAARVAAAYELQPGSDGAGNIVVYLTNRGATKQARARARRRNLQLGPAKTFKLYMDQRGNPSTAVFDGIAPVSQEAFTDAELAAGKLLAHLAGKSKLSDKEVAALKAIVAG